jgi:photosystem II stability/assembly factor-like uncharacterized protein
MKDRWRPADVLIVLALALSLVFCGAGGARADIQSPWITVRPGAVLAVATTPSALPGSPKVVFIGTAAAALKSEDGGLTWTQVFAGATYSLAADPAVPGVVYAATATGLQRTTDFGQSWTLLNASIRTTVAVSPFDSQVIFGGIYRSVDGGATWTAMAGLTGASATGHLRTSRDPANPGVLLYHTGSGVYRSADNGLSWTRVNVGFAEDSSELDPVDARYFYIGACGGTIYRAYPGGSSTSANIGGHVHAIVVDPADHRRVYAARDSGGVAVSLD